MSATWIHRFTLSHRPHEKKKTNPTQRRRSRRDWDRNKRRSGDTATCEWRCSPWTIGQESLLQESSSSHVVSNARISLFACENSNKMVFTRDISYVYLLAAASSRQRHRSTTLFDEKFVTLFLCVESIRFSHWVFRKHRSRTATAVRRVHSAAFMFRLTQIIRTFLCSVKMSERASACDEEGRQPPIEY